MLSGLHEPSTAVSPAAQVISLVPLHIWVWSVVTMCERVYVWCVCVCGSGGGGWGDVGEL